MTGTMAGKRVLVTGGSRGIGLATCVAFARECARVATCARGQESLDAALAQIGEAAIGTALDVRDEGAFAAWVSDSSARMGGVDVVMSNVSTRVDPKSPSWWGDTFEADLMQHVRLKALALPLMAEGGSMLFMASIAAVLTTLPPYEEAYGAMKAGLVNLVGQGEVRYVASWPDAPLLDRVVRAMAETVGVVVTALPRDLRLRRAGNYVFAFNYGPEAIDLAALWPDAASFDYRVGGVVIAAAGVAVWTAGTCVNSSPSAQRR